jgi:hypothetical protein
MGIQVGVTRIHIERGFPAEMEKLLHYYGPDES